MRTAATGAASLRHVGLVALEALLIAAIVWVATMALAGATQSDGLAGSAHAGRTTASITIAAAGRGHPVVATVTPSDAGMWVHATCSQAGSTVSSVWARVDAHGRASFDLGRSDRWSSGDASCVGEEGYFSANGRWRVLASTNFAVQG